MNRLLSLGAAALLAAGCRQDMHDTPRYEPFERSAFFEDGRSTRPIPEGTVARGRLQLDEHLYTGRVGGELARTLPFDLTREVLDRGRERYLVFCSPCHGRSGYGEGQIVKRGMQRPPSFHSARLRNVPPGHVFEVVTKGTGAMYDYADRIPPEDRWAIAAYVQALQLSQDATLADVPPDVRARLEEERP